MKKFCIGTKGAPDKVYLAAIRRKSLDCHTGSHVEAERCSSFDCPFWMFRIGKYASGSPCGPGGSKKIGDNRLSNYKLKIQEDPLCPRISTK